MSATPMPGAEESPIRGQTQKNNPPQIVANPQNETESQTLFGGGWAGVAKALGLFPGIGVNRAAFSGISGDQDYSQLKGPSFLSNDRSNVGYAVLDKCTNPLYLSGHDSMIQRTLRITLV
jgi:hypothetical protein